MLFNRIGASQLATQVVAPAEGEDEALKEEGEKKTD